MPFCPTGTIYNTYLVPYGVERSLVPFCPKTGHYEVCKFVCVCV